MTSGRHPVAHLRLEEKVVLPRQAEQTDDELSVLLEQSKHWDNSEKSSSSSDEEDQLVRVSTDPKVYDYATLVKVCQNELEVAVLDVLKDIRPNKQFPLYKP